ncbi:hypothetical protein PUN28_016416 [Cardiocondyla obscurior]|uniref:Uncharacterized protein n=1 Tax=Cardiocondyla obscurior TaxID=286306 RepID=A0AAW2EPB2_9HYME
MYFISVYLSLPSTCAVRNEEREPRNRSRGYDCEIDLLFFPFPSLRKSCPNKSVARVAMSQICFTLARVFPKLIHWLLPAAQGRSGTNRFVHGHGHVSTVGNVVKGSGLVKEIKFLFKQGLILYIYAIYDINYKTNI